MKKYLLAVLTALTVLIPMVTLVAQAADPDFGGENRFRNVWIQQDRLVGAPGIERPYTWGPNAPGAPTVLSEPYNSSPGGQRRVLYLDKARMEINNPATGLVTTGLAVKELVSGLRQDGDTTFTPLAPSKTQVAGDAANINPNTPVYESFRNVVTLGNADDRSKPSAVGSVITAFIAKNGSVSTITSPEQVTIGAYEAQTGHNIARPFQDFKNIRGPVTDPVTGNTQQNQPIYTNDPTSNVFGLAISEPYWVTSKIAGVERLVLVQLFERRVLTYNPALATSKVEMGNLGQHYYQWRYVETTTPTTTPTTPPTTTVPAVTVPLDYSQARANYNKGGGEVIGGASNIRTYNASSVINSSAALDLSKNLAVVGTNDNGLHGINLTNMSNAFIFKPSANPSFNSDPAIFNGTIYAGAGNGRVYAINLTASGTSVTEKDKTAEVGGGAVKGSVAFAPDAKQLYYSVGNTLYAVDLNNLGTQKWIQVAGGTLTGPVVDASGNIFAGSSDGKLHAFKPDGTKLDTFYPITLNGGLTNITPTLANGAVYVGTDAGRVYKLNPGNGTTIWATDVAPLTDINTTIAVVGTSVYVGTDGSRVHKLSDGNGAVDLSANFTSSGAVKSSVAVVGNFYYFGDDTGRVYKVDVNNVGNRTELLGAGDSIGGNSPVVAEGKVYIARNTGTFYVID